MARNSMRAEQLLNERKEQMSRSIEAQIADALIELGDGDDYRREQIVESFAENATNDFLEEIGLNSDEAFAIIYPAVTKAIMHTIDWGRVDKELTDTHEEAVEWFKAMEESLHE